ncbi:hypothetical protein GGR50DRAFT_705686 [Xylaria sp. CBS 124048]|nr:hypothetical protein GGR50DRAFT_705686 [Xylaria sp. CBS 124048]
MPSQHSAEYNLRRVLPTAGMIYPEGDVLLHSVSRDKKVYRALRATGCRATTSSVQSAFVRMFQLATPICIKGRAEGKSLWDMLPELKGKLDWGRRLAEAVFLGIFTRLVEARHRWEENPLPPFADHSKYSALVLEIMRFLEAVKDCSGNGSRGRPTLTSWILTDAMIYNELAGGKYLSEDEDGDVEMADANPAEGLIQPMVRMTLDEKMEED